jgi:hypothetical protein
MVRNIICVLIAIGAIGVMAIPTDVSAARSRSGYSVSNHGIYRGGHNVRYRSAYRVSYRRGYHSYPYYIDNWPYYSGPYYAVRPCPVDILCYIQTYPGFRSQPY